MTKPKTEEVAATTPVVAKTEDTYSKPGFAYIHEACSAYAFFMFDRPVEGEHIKGYDYQGRRLHGAINCLSCGGSVTDLKLANVVEIKN